MISDAANHSTSKEVKISRSSKVNVAWLGPLLVVLPVDSVAIKPDMVILGAIGGLSEALLKINSRTTKKNKMEEQQRPHSSQGQHCHKADHGHCQHGSQGYYGGRRM